MMQIVSKTQGWITVSPKTMNRKEPIEKIRLGDASKVNVLSPTWMQVTHEKPGPDPLRVIGAMAKDGVIVKAENNRTILVEKSQPKRSIFNIGSFRHNVHSEDLANQWKNAAIQSGKFSERPSRLLEWNEPERSKQKFDKNVSPKIGSNHFV
jgi:hypothetical protein